MGGPGGQFIRLLILGIPVACVTWTVTHEEVFRELREWCGERSKSCPALYQRKFFYLLTCEYCFSHYVAGLFLALAGFRMLLPGWRGLLVAWFSLVWIANLYVSLFGRLRLDIKHERVEIAATEKEADVAMQNRGDTAENRDRISRSRIREETGAGVR